MEYQCMLVSQNARIHVPTESDSPDCVIMKSVITGKSYEFTESDSPECVIVKSVLTSKS